MNEWTEAQKQLFSRFQEILTAGKQRYLQAGGEVKRYRAGFKDKDFLSDEERQEAAEIMRQMFGINIQDGSVICQGRSWNLAQKKPV
jgi:hypothetical protein